MNWQHLEMCGVTKRNEADTPDVASLIPAAPVRPDSKIDVWFDEASENDTAGLFRGFVSDHVGIELGGRVAVHLCTAESPEDGSKLYAFLAAAGLTSLIVVDPFREQEEAGAHYGDMQVLYVREDPLRFLSQIDPGPTVLFNSFYAGGFAGEQTEKDYYVALANEVLRVISDSRNIVIAPGMLGSGVPIAAGMNVELFHAMLPPDKDKGEWRFRVAQAVVVNQQYVAAVALKAKSEQGSSFLDEP